jgi:diaminohydroxyphosphoribosylaminopyrimidine deaminase/5-amino-6-(5-phosphoribosylamino)uracil reductase
MRNGASEQARRRAGRGLDANAIAPGTSGSAARRDAGYMRLALRLARRSAGRTAPNPMVGAVLVRGGRILGQGWHRRAGGPHAEIEALMDARDRGHAVAGATLYVTLEPCSTVGRTPPCTTALTAARLRRVVVATMDPNPRHAGRGYGMLRRRGLRVDSGLLACEAQRLNEAFFHWIVHRRPWVTVKAAMTLDGKIATRGGESKWITGARARAAGMRLRAGADAIVAGIGTVLADDPSLTVRSLKQRERRWQPLRVILDSLGRTPLKARVVRDGWACRTIVVVTRQAPARRRAALARQVRVWVAPRGRAGIDLRWVLGRLGAEGVTSLLVEGGGEVSAAFLGGGVAHRVVFFYAPKVLREAGGRRAVAGLGARRWPDVRRLSELEWRRLGPDLMLTARVGGGGTGAGAS